MEPRKERGLAMVRDIEVRREDVICEKRVGVEDVKMARVAQGG